MKWFLPFGLLALAASSTVVLANDSDWWKTMTLYQIYPRSFKDSDGDGIGDLPGIESKLEHIVDAGFDTIWLSPIYPSPMVDFGYDISDFLDIEPIFGTMEDFESLLAKAKSLSLKVLLDFVPNHTSDQHEWFVKSLAGIEPYKDYFVWHNGTVLENGTITVPNNWMSLFSGSAWTWRDERQAYYLHQFTVQQPDLDYRNEYVVEEMKDIMHYWLDKGIDGFRVDAVPYLFEDDTFLDEPPSGYTNDTSNYNYLSHIYTKDQDGNYEIVKVMREVVDNYTLNSDNITKIILTEAYANMSLIMKYYEYGSHMPFNFFLVYLSNSSTPSSFKNMTEWWMESMPTDGTANWVLGNHDRSRVATRYGSERVDGLTMMLLLLPGVGVIYNGDEIGMEDTWISWEDTVDPQACNTDSEVYESYSRDLARTPFQWDNTTSAGFSTNATTWLPVNENYITLNLAAQKAADVSHYKVYQKLNALRKLPIVQNGSLNAQVLGDDQVLAFSRESTDYESVIVLISFANTTTTVGLDVFESASETLTIYVASVDSGLNAGDKVQRSSVELPAFGAVVLISESTTSESSTSESTTPESSTSESTTPESTTPESTTPESTTSESSTSESTTPESTTPESTTPESTTPESTTPESTTPESTTPESSTSESSTSESTTPESTTPESTTPESSIPESSALESSSSAPTFLPSIVISLLAASLVNLQR